MSAPDIEHITYARSVADCEGFGAAEWDRQSRAFADELITDLKSAHDHIEELEDQIKSERSSRLDVESELEQVKIHLADAEKKLGAIRSVAAE